MNGKRVGRPGWRALTIALLSALASTAYAASPASQSDIEILWDTWGVPHIFAPDDEALYYGLGWTQMHNHPVVMLRLYGQARGRAAEYWGESFVESDSQVHRLRVIDRAEEWVKLQDPEFLKLLEAFVRGVNDYAARHPEEIPDELEQVLPVRVIDLFAHQQRAGVLPFASGTGAPIPDGRLTPGIELPDYLRNYTRKK